MGNERGGDGEYLESEDTKSFYVASKSENESENAGPKPKGRKRRR